MVDEIDVTAIVRDEQYEDDHSDHVMLIEKQILEWRLLEMESLVHVVVHDNSNLRAHLKGLEINKSYVNVPTTEKKILS